jgi:hypothetical protein
VFVERFLGADVAVIAPCFTNARRECSPIWIASRRGAVKVKVNAAN